MSVLLSGVMWDCMIPYVLFQVVTWIFFHTLFYHLSKFVKFYKFIYNEIHQQDHISSLKRIAFIIRNWIPLSLWVLFPAKISIIPITYLSITAMTRTSLEIDTLFYYTLLFVAISTHCGRVTHICVSELAIIGSDKWLAAWTAPSHYLNQCWNIVNWNLRKQNPYIFIQEIAFENVVCEMAAILSRPQYVNKSSGLYDALTHILQGCFTDTEEMVWFYLFIMMPPSPTYLLWKYISIFNSNLIHVAWHVVAKKDMNVILCCPAKVMWHYYKLHCRWQCCHWLQYLCMAHWLRYIDSVIQRYYYTSQ